MSDRPVYDLHWTSAQQARASDPRASAWVAANAGSGKTHVLAQRVVRLLLAGARPSAILCLTYTKAAAAEMSNRVFSRLSRWTALPDDLLATELHELEGRAPDPLHLASARRLFARALETPGGLKIQTIHAFCEALLHRFPLEANVAAHFTVMDDAESATLLAEARRSLLSATTIEDEAELAGAFRHVLEAVGEFGLDRLLDDLVARRTAISRFHAHAARRGGIAAALHDAVGIATDETEDMIARRAWPLAALPVTVILRLCQAAEADAAATPREFFGRLAACDAMEPSARLEALRDLFFKKDGEIRSLRRVATKGISAAIADIAERLEAAAAAVDDSADRLRTFRMLQATRAAHVLAARLLSDYDRLKRQRGRLDFDDLVERATALLGQPGAGAWVHYKLDQGIDHILVDEAQDTSPRQWAIVGHLVEEFFAGSEDRRQVRTLFAVGDEKQSIYSFQGARPERFRQEGWDAGRRAAAAEKRFEDVALRLSFRSTADVLGAVDTIFADADHKRGLGPADSLIEHGSARGRDPGRVDLWEMIGKEKRPDDEDWTAPFDDTPESDPKAQLARRVAATIRDWIGRESIVSKGQARPIRAGDILVLVRKRDGFVNALSRALKQRPAVTIAGADRLRLVDHVAVKDLIALGRAVILPDDDLSLAAVLKSPIFDLSEDDLFRLCHERPEGSGVADHLKQLGEVGEQPFAAAYLRFRHLAARARASSVHDFYAELLGPGGARAAFLARLGHEAADLLDEFLSFALAHERSGLPGLGAFLAVLEAQSPEIKREMEQGRDEVRVMTVHASKGLEAPIVFLVDSGGVALQPQHVPKLRETDAASDVPSPILWVPGSAFENRLSLGLKQAVVDAAEEEYRRLLYVALTRAADRLVICGYHGINKPVRPHWHRMVEAALGKHDRARQMEFSAGGLTWPGLSFGTDIEPGDATKAGAVLDVTEPHIPPELARPLPPPALPPRPLVPSGASSIINAANEAPVRSPLFDRIGSGRSGASRALERGKLLHRLLQVLPGIEIAERHAAARRYMARAAPDWTAEDADALVAEALAVLEHPQFARVFAPGSRPEVSVMGTVTLAGRAHVVSGRFDRMAVAGEDILIVDYKTNRPAIRDLDDVPFGYRAQMALYRALIAPLYPAAKIAAALVFTEAPALITLPDAVLDAAIAELTTK